MSAICKTSLHTSYSQLPVEQYLILTLVPKLRNQIFHPVVTLQYQKMHAINASPKFAALHFLQEIFC